MKIIKLLTLFVILFTNQLFAQTNSDDDNKKRLSEAFIIENAEIARFGEIYLPGEYIYNDGKLIGQSYISSSYSEEISPGNKGKAFLTFVNDQFWSVSLTNVSCRKTDVIASDFLLTYDNKNRISRIEIKTYSRMGKVLTKPFYSIEYANDLISKVTSGHIISEDKDVFSYAASETFYDQENANKIKIKNIEYSKPKNKKDKSLPVNQSEKLYDFNGNNLKVTTEGNNSSVVIYEAKENEVIVTRDHLLRTITTDGVKVIKVEDKTFNDAKSVIGHEIVTYAYGLKSPGLPQEDACSYSITSGFKTIYDSDGNAIQEITNRKTRKKLPDGSWSEWKSMTM